MNVGNEKITLEEGKEQLKSKTASSSKFRLFGSSERLIDREKKDKENVKEEELQRTDTPTNQNDNSIAVTHTTVGKMESSPEATENSDEQKSKGQVLSMEKQTSNSEEDEGGKKEDTNLTKSKSKSISMKNLFFASGKHSKQKVEKNKEEDHMLEEKEIANAPTSDSICKDDEDDAINKKRSGIINLLFTPPEKRSKQKDEKAKQNSEKEENKKDTEITSNEAEFFVEIPLSDNAAECQDEVKEQEPSMEEVNIVGDIDEPSNEESRNMSPKKAKTPSKINFLFSSGKQSKNKPEERKEEAPKEQEGLLTGADDQNGEMSHNEEKESSSDKKESLVENNSSKSNAELTNEVKQEEKQDAMIKDEPPSVSGNQGERSISKEEREAESSTEMYSPKNVVELKNEAEQDIEVREVSISELSQGKESSMRESFKNRTECPAEIISSENTNEAIKEVKQDIKPMEKVPIIIVTQDEECICEGEEEILTNKGEKPSEKASAENFIDLKNKTEPQEAPMVTNESNNSITMKGEESSRLEGKEFSMDSREFITEITKCFDEIKDDVKNEELSEEKPELEEDNTNDERSSTNIPTSTTVSAVTISISSASRDHSKPKIDDEKDENIMKDEETSEDTNPQSEESKGKEGSANKIESTENVTEQTSKGKPPEVSEDQPIIDTPSDEVPNLGKEMDTSVGTSSSRMHTLFGSTGKHSKSKKNLKQENISKKAELSSVAVTANEDLKDEEDVNSSLDKAKSSSMRKLLFGKRSKQKYEEHRDLQKSKALDDEGNTDDDGNNPTDDNKVSSIEISPATSENPTEMKHEMREQDGPSVIVELHEEISENNKTIQQEEDSRTKRKKIPASGKTGFFSLPDRRSKMRNEVRSQEVAMSEKQPPSALKEIKQGEKESTQGNSNTPRKRGLLSTLDKRKKVKHEARIPEVSLEKEENSKPGNVESISSERERPSLGGTETTTNTIVEFQNERAVDVGEINDNCHKPKSESKEDLLKSSSYPRRKGKARTELKKEDISLQKDMRHTTHVTWDPIKKNFILHYTDNEGLRRILLEENLCREAPVPRQRRHSYSMAMDESDAEIFEEIPRASIQSYSSVTSNPKSSGKTRRRVPKARPRSEIVRGNQPLTEL
ncbi:hypothetical protein J437_LFUL005435 [Ladona fulva]|uniref:Uncharacterized protein n=1 Tax=Ladona fulva TaxID=123851 RepID=A0A8K0JWZ4_LADFU|nr:hypothetical protein J437_LFUL005435 [Ladona fulva]